MLVSRPLRPDLVPVGVELMLRWGWVAGESSQEGVHESKRELGITALLLRFVLWRPLMLMQCVPTYRAQRLT